MKARLPILLVLLAVFARPSSAHEIGKTQVTVIVRDGNYQADIAVDPDALLTKLEVFSGAPLSDGLKRTARDRRIMELSSTFLERVLLRFDSTTTRPSFEYVPASTLGDVAQAPSLVRLSGTVPAGATNLTFAYGLALGSYALNVR